MWEIHQILLGKRLKKHFRPATYSMDYIDGCAFLRRLHQKKEIDRGLMPDLPASFQSV
jgi:hypothetical protein